MQQRRTDGRRTVNTCPKRVTPLGILSVVPRDERMARAEAVAAAADAYMGLVDEDEAEPARPAPFIPTRERPCPQMRSRGVRVMDYFDSSGNPVVHAVDEDGRTVAWLAWTENRTLESVEDELWTILNVRTSLR